MTKTIAIVGFAPQTIDRVETLKPDDEMWTLNFAWQQDAIKYGRIDALFDIHPPWYLNTVDDSSVRHKEWLKKKHDFPVYTNPTVYDDRLDWIKSGVRYPLEEVIRATGMDNSLRGEQVQNMFGSTMDYMVALAITKLEAGDIIRLIGIEMQTETEYAYQKATMGYWMGIANAKGIIVKQEDISTLIRPLPYHEGGQMIGRQTVEGHLQMVKNAQSKALGVYNQLMGVANKEKQILADYLERQGGRPPNQDELKPVIEAEQAASQAKAQLDAASGALTGFQNLLREFDMAETPTYVEPKMTTTLRVDEPIPTSPAANKKSKKKKRRKRK